MELDDEAKDIVQGVAAAINAAVERSAEVAEAIERLREAGYDMELTLRLEIGLREREDSDRAGMIDTDGALDLTDEDLRTLRRMKIRIDEEQ